MIWAVVLAAGASTRMGEAKALLRLADGRRFVDAIAATARAAGTGGVLVVVGPPHGATIRAGLPPGAGAAWNPQPERGMLSSVQAGLAALPGGASAALIWPVDIPFVRAATVRAILDAAPGRIVVPVHNKRGGHPLRVPRRFFGEIAALERSAPERGLKALLDAHAGEVERLAVADRAVLVDVDTPEDYARTRA
jgi:CTP:molybdopterin cytidylyltransferase MocA